MLVEIVIVENYLYFYLRIFVTIYLYQLNWVNTICYSTLQGTIVSIFNEDTSLGKKYVFDIRRTCREVYDNARRALYQNSGNNGGSQVSASPSLINTDRLSTGGRSQHESGEDVTNSDCLIEQCKVFTKSVNLNCVLFAHGAESFLRS